MKADGRGGYSSVIKVPDTNKALSEMKFSFALIATNKFYNLTQNYEMKLLEIVTPGAVEALKVMNDLTTHSSAFLTFSLPKELAKVSGKMSFDIRLKLADEDSSMWKKIENPRLQMTEGEGYLVIDHLEYANIIYAMKIRTKSKYASDVNEMWSPFKEISFKTRPTLPRTPPETCANCFNVMDNGNVVIYWMEVSKYYRNADNFSYLVRVSDESEVEIMSVGNLNDTSLVLRNDLSADNLKIKLFSVNSEGITENFNQLVINLRQLQTHKKVLKIRKELTSGEYKVSWKQLETLEVESYTVFWCHQRNDLPNQCGASIKFTQVHRDKSAFILKATESYQFGVAANLRDKSIVQGFQWAECTTAKSNGEFEICLISHKV